MLPINSTSYYFDLDGASGQKLTLATTSTGRYIHSATLETGVVSTNPELTCDGVILASTINIYPTTYNLNYFCKGAITATKSNIADAHINILYTTTTPIYGITYYNNDSLISNDKQVDVYFYGILLFFILIFFWKEKFIIPRYD